MKIDVFNWWSNNMLNAYFKTYENDENKVEKFQYILNKFEWYQKKLRPYNKSLHEYSTLLYGYAMTKDENKINKLWKEMPLSYHYNINIFQNRCEFLQDINQSLKAKEYITAFKQFHKNITSYELKIVNEIEEKLDENIKIEIENKVLIEVSIPKNISKKEYDKTYVIIISLENYFPRETDEMPSVKYANNDANLFKETLIKYMNVKEEDIRMFMNESATRSSLKFDLKGLFDVLTEKDRLIFYYAGHGFHNGETNYITDYDTHRKHIIESSISLREVLLDPFSKSKGKSLIVFIDACATNIQDENSRHVLSNIDYNDSFKVEKNNNLYSATFFSCQAGQSSYSCDKLKHGIWTYHLNKAISGKEPTLITNKQFISDRTLVDYLKTEVHKYTKTNLGYEQSPKAILDADSEFVLVEIK